MADQIARLVDDISGRVEAIEERLADLDTKAATVAAARQVWRPVLVSRAKLLLMSEAGDRGSIDLAAAKALAAGKQLDVDVGDAEEDRVQLVDPRGRVVADLPQAALLSLRKTLTSVDAAGLLGEPVRVRPDPDYRTGGVFEPSRPANAGVRRVSAPEPSSDSCEDVGSPHDDESGAVPDRSGAEPGLEEGGES